MLRSRLTPVGSAIVTLLVVAGCSEGGALEENVVRPGITAIEQASELACNSDAATLRAAMEAYELLEGDPAPDEATLVAEQFLRDESELWDIVDSELVAVDPGCGTVPTDAPDTVEIVTATVVPQRAEEIFDTFTAAQIDDVGGEACARQLAEIIAAANRYVSEVGGDPPDLEQLVDGGFLEAMPTSWEIVDGVLAPVDGSGCHSLG